MTRITNTDQVMLLLRAQLERKSKADKKRTTGTGVEKPTFRQSPLNRVQSMAKEDVLSGNEINRALIAGILTQEFGPTIANDPAFQKVVDDVLGVINQDESGKKLLELSVEQLGNID